MNLSLSFAALVTAGLAFSPCAVVTPALAAEDLTIADLQVATRAIGFLDSTPHDGTIIIGLVHGDTAESKAKAVQAAALLGGLPGPDRAKLRIVLIAGKSLAQAQGRLDAVILMPNQTLASDEMAKAVRRRRVVSISTDPSCIDAKCCVLLVQTGSRVNIVLDTALASEVGAQFSSVFTMLVKRR